MNDASSITQETSPPRSPAHLFNLYGWQPDPTKSDDENYMDIVFLITRSARDGQQGHMGALIVKPPGTINPHSDDTDQGGTTHEDRIFHGILGAATNTPLFGVKESTSDIHAEIGALGQACRACHSTENCTAYITIPPCKRCFAALVAFGVKRIFTRQVSPKLIRETAANHGIYVENFSKEMNRSQMERINKLVNKDKTDEELMETAEQNKIRRQNRKLRKEKKQELND
jgi:deoxycytidylate deaminase